MRCEVWIASHFGRGNPQNHRQVLLETLRSLADQTAITTVRISLSAVNIDDPPTDQQMRACLTTQELIVYRHDQAQLQFDHLRYIHRHFDGSPKTVVMFMDDDDILLHMPKFDEVPRVAVLQYLPRGQTMEEEIIPAAAWKHLTTTRPELFEIVSDFSGYMCTVADFTNYLESTKNVHILRKLEDAHFMNYLDSLPHVTPEPFIGHRLWRSLDEKDWTC